MSTFRRWLLQKNRRVSKVWARRHRFLLFEQSYKLLNAPFVVSESGSHRWRHAKRLMASAEVVSTLADIGVRVGEIIQRLMAVKFRSTVNG